MLQKADNVADVAIKWRLFCSKYLIYQSCFIFLLLNKLPRRYVRVKSAFESDEWIVHNLPIENPIQRWFNPHHHRLCYWPFSKWPGHRSARKHLLDSTSILSVIAFTTSSTWVHRVSISKEGGLGVDIPEWSIFDTPQPLYNKSLPNQHPIKFPFTPGRYSPFYRNQ